MVRLSLITLAAVAVSTVAARRCPGAFINCRYASDAVCTAGCSHIFWGCAAAKPGKTRLWSIPPAPAILARFMAIAEYVFNEKRGSVSEDVSC
ncbi:hypothetical protein C8034_v010848 [Colletotrichum sidae]|uniref:Secreted protein n=1 Tax=Colletotrichum sidae TaxID=1347389 RepID=A0A4V3I1I1_9PEZI|nr:hypothetical protein C8034_v010848 [Colletotrichum sidae]